MPLIMTVSYVPGCYLHSSENGKHFENFFLGPGLIPFSQYLSKNIKAKKEQQKKRIILEFCATNVHLHLFMEIQDRFA